MEKEPNTQENSSLNETVDKFFAGVDSPKGKDSSPEQDQAPESQESVTDTPKTEVPEDTASFEGVDKGFANHPAWKKREEKLKEAQAELEKYRQSSKTYDELLGDPVIFKRYLERQGYTADKIRDLMAERGFQVEKAKVSEEAIEAEVCKELGWDINALDAKQQAYIKDLVAMSKTVSERVLSKHLEERLKPFESFVKQSEQQKKTAEATAKASEYAKKYGFDWDKDILPALSNHLDELDKKDPQGRIPFDVVDWVRDLLPSLVEERAKAQARQEDRNERKAVAKPLKPGATLTQPKEKLKGRTVRETADKFLDAVGFNH